MRKKRRIEKIDLELDLQGYSSSYGCDFHHGVLQQMHLVGMEEAWNPISDHGLHQGPY